jgi:hypothetical protein
MRSSFFIAGLKLALFHVFRCRFQLFKEEIEKEAGDGISLTTEIDFPMIAIIIVAALFLLAIISPWVFPNKMVSKNEHDLKH